MEASPEAASADKSDSLRLVSGSKYKLDPTIGLNIVAEVPELREELSASLGK